MTRLLICGSRIATPNMLAYAARAVERARDLGWQLIVGDAEGVDEQVIYKACWANIPFTFYGIRRAPRHFCCLTHLQNYIRVGPDYLARDRLMVESADRVLAIWNGQSRGTFYTYRYAQKLGKAADLITFTGSIDA